MHTVRGKLHLSCDPTGFYDPRQPHVSPIPPQTSPSPADSTTSGKYQVEDKQTQPTSVYVGTGVSIVLLLIATSIVTVACVIYRRRRSKQSRPKISYTQSTNSEILQHGGTAPWNVYTTSNDDVMSSDASTPFSHDHYEDITSAPSNIAQTGEDAVDIHYSTVDAPRMPNPIGKRTEMTSLPEITYAQPDVHTKQQPPNDYDLERPRFVDNEHDDATQYAYATSRDVMMLKPEVDTKQADAEAFKPDVTPVYAVSAKMKTDSGKLGNKDAGIKQLNAGATKPGVTPVYAVSGKVNKTSGKLGNQDAVNTQSVDVGEPDLSHMYAVSAKMSQSRDADLTADDDAIVMTENDLYCAGDM